MESFRFNKNGERDGYAAEENNPATAYRGGASHSQLSQLPQPESHRVFSEDPFRYLPSGEDLETLESSLRSLSVLESGAPYQNPLLDSRRSNRSSSSSSPQRINGGDGGGGKFWSILTHHREMESSLRMFQYLRRSSSQSDCVNGGSFGYDANAHGQSSSNNGAVLQNGNSRDVPYLSRNRFLDQSSSTNGFGSGIGGFVVNNRREESLSLEIARGSIFWLAKDRDSSNELQRKISVCSKETIDMIFDNVISHVCELMVDPFGHHVVEKLMEKCSSEQITQILDLVTLHQYRFVDICNDPLGTRAMQSLLRCLHSEDQVLRIVEAISMVALNLTKNNNARHLILQCFNQFPHSQIRNLLEVIARNCYEIAIDQHGSCMLQNCLGINSNELKGRLIHAIITNALRLCVNCYGNYLVQYVVELQDPYVTLDLVRQLVGHYAYLSRNKYGSHAVQKLLRIQYIDSSLIVYDLLRDIDTLLLDPFGNYVIQTAWFVCQNVAIRSSLMWHIQRNKRLMRCNKFGNKILEKLNL